MNPDEFLNLALRLSNSDREADRRSAVSRAYYALFHTARLLLDACGVTCPQSAESHDRIAKCLQHSGVAEVVVAGRESNSLRTIRNHADYRLDDRRFGDGRFIQIQLGAVRKIHQALTGVGRA